MGANSLGPTREMASRSVEVDWLQDRNLDPAELRRVKCVLTDSLWTRMLRMIFPDQRKQERLVTPPLVGYLGTACASRPFELGDISLTGFCFLTSERWTPGTEMPITLRRTNLPAGDDKNCFTVQATVMRSDGEGVGFSIVLNEEESNAVQGNPLRVRWITRQEMAEFLERLKTEPGSDPGRPRNSVKTASTQAGAGAQLKAAFEGGD